MDVSFVSIYLKIQRKALDCQIGKGLSFWYGFSYLMSENSYCAHLWFQACFRSKTIRQSATLNPDPASIIITGLRSISQISGMDSPKIATF